MDCCAYCGDYYQCRDHVIPISYMSTHRYYGRGDTVKCCNMCNRYAGANIFFSVTEKARFLYHKYIFKKRKALSFPLWEENDVSKLGYSLRVDVQKSLYIKKLIQRKIENLDLVSNGFLPEVIQADLKRAKSETKSLGLDLDKLFYSSDGTDTAEDDAEIYKKLRKEQELLKYKGLKNTVSSNYKVGRFYYIFSNKEKGVSVKVFNKTKFLKLYELKSIKGTSWTQRDIKYKTKSKAQIYEIAKDMINSGAAIC